MIKKFQIFISSTFRDLEEERQDTIKSILDMDHIPSGMEAFPAADIEQFEYIKKVIDECDYYILIISARYGSIDSQGISFTEREYDYAKDSGKVILSFIHDETNKIAVEKVDTDVNLARKLELFRNKVKQGRLVKHWNTRASLQHAIVLSLTKAFSMFPAVGWIRGNNIASDELLRQINDLRNEKEELVKQASKSNAKSLPKIENLAQLDDTHTINYTYIPMNSSSKSSASFEATWNDIFKIIGINLSRPTIPVVVDSSLRKLIVQNYPLRKSISFPDIETAQVKFQLMGLGLIKSQIANATDGKSYEFISLTDEAKIKLYELLAVRTKSGEVND